jgi:hypothetical protein
MTVGEDMKGIFKKIRAVCAAYDIVNANRSKGKRPYGKRGGVLVYLKVVEF